MTSLKEKLFLSFKKRHFYYKILFPFSILSILLVCILTCINWYWIEEETNEKIARSNRQFLTRAVQAGDSYLYDTYTSLLNRYFLDGYNVSKMDRFITYGDKLKASEFLNLFQTMQLICSQNSNLVQIGLYQQKSDLYMDNIRGLTYNASSQTADSYRYIQDYLSVSQKSEKGIIYYTPYEENAGSNQLVILHSLPMYANFSDEKGFIVLTVNMTNLDEMLNMISLTEQNAFFIISPEGQLLFSKAPFENFYETVSAQCQSSKTPFEFFTVNDTKYRLDETVSSASGYRYISCVPINLLKAESRNRHQLMLMIAIICVLFALLSAQRISSKAYQPIANLRERLDSNPSGEIKDDLSLIEGTLSFLENQVDDIQSMLRQNNQVLLYKIFMDILNKKQLSDQQLMHKLNLCGIDIKHSDYCLLLIEFDQSVFYNLTAEQREYLIGKAGSMLPGLLHETVIHSIEAYPDNRMAVLLNFDADSYDILTEHFEKLPDFISDKLHIRVNLSYSTPVKALSEISDVYSHISDYLKYSFTLGYGNIFSDKLINKLEHAPFSLTLQDYQHAERLIRDGNPDEFYALMESYRKTVEAGECSYQEANNILIQIYRIAFHASKEKGVFNDAAKKEQILYDFNHAVDFAHSLDCICLIVQMYQESLHVEVQNADAQFIQQIIAYLQQHRLEELSLSSVAQEFHVSTGHLSRLFKSVTAENFSAYVINLKLETAAEMLNSQPDKSIQAIAAELGYYTPAYFTRLFKEKFGVTPSQYRKN